MEENLSPKDRYQDDAPRQESAEDLSSTPQAVIEPEDAGGDPPCWAHMLDDEGQLPERSE